MRSSNGIIYDHRINSDFIPKKYSVLCFIHEGSAAI